MSITENISQEFRLKNIDETTNYFLEEIGQIELMSKKHKKVFWALNDVKNLLCFSFYSYWMCLHIWFCIFSRYYCSTAGR